MTYFKDKQGNPFYEPSEAVIENHSLIQITEAEFNAIVTELNKPVQPTKEQVEKMRLAAYADPLTGSDRHFAEAARLEAVGDTEGAESARAAGLARYDEIRLQYPWPETAE